MIHLFKSFNSEESLCGLTIAQLIQLDPDGSKMVLVVPYTSQTSKEQLLDNLISCVERVECPFCLAQLPKLSELKIFL